jgi:hypothetical protein
VDRYVRPMDLSSRFCEPCLGSLSGLASKGVTDGRDKWIATNPERD